MALYIYDHGYKVKTPVDSEFPQRNITPVSTTGQQGTATDSQSSENPVANALKILTSDREKRQERGARRAMAYANTAATSTGSVKERRQLAISHIMKGDVQTISKEATVVAAWRRIMQHQIHHLIVVDENQKPIGILSDRDILMHGRSSTDSITGVYSTKLIAATPETLVRDVAFSFVEYDLHCMPILDGNEKVIGVVTRSDLLHLLVSGPNLQRWV